MAFRHKEIYNINSRQGIRFLQTAKDTQGAFLEMETTYQSHSAEPPAHYHPQQVEDFEVISGELSIRLEERMLTLYPGDRLHIPVNTAHSMWNNSAGKTVVHWKVQPALNTEYLLETGTGLANDGKINAKGVPNLWQLSMMMQQFGGVFRLSWPPYWLQRMVFTVLSPIAYLLGYRGSYRRYID